MSLEIRNSKSLIDPAKTRIKVLIYGLPGTGKTAWAATAPNPGFAACETGHGQGLLTLADRGVDFCTPNSLTEFDQICQGKVFGDKETIVLDSLSDMSRTFIKDAALQIPRSRGESDKRKRGIPELDDYGIMAEITRKLLRNLLSQDKHIIVTATERYDKPDPENGQGEMLVGPDLPGQMFLGSTAMFDVVFRLRTRPALRDPRDAKTRYTQRYLLTQPDGAGSIVKCRFNKNGMPVLDKELVFDPATGAGTFADVLQRIQQSYQ